jgi:putative lipoic acid-binding regulatory protein
MSNDHTPAQPAAPANPPGGALEIPHDQSLITYPNDFPIKVMGLHHEEFIATVVTIVQAHAPDFTPDDIVHRPSSGGKYLGLTVTVKVHNREQLDNIYRSLTGHPLVKYVL